MMTRTSGLPRYQDASRMLGKLAGIAENPITAVTVEKDFDPSAAMRADTGEPSALRAA